MNKHFRIIKENDNLDLLEESDDEDEFENIDEDKYVYLDEHLTLNVNIIVVLKMGTFQKN